MAEERIGTGMTVNQLMDRLYRFPPGAKLVIATGQGSDMQILSLTGTKVNKRPPGP